MKRNNEDDFLMVACAVIVAKLGLPTYQNVGRGDTSSDERAGRHIRAAARTIYAEIAEEMEVIAKT